MDPNPTTPNPTQTNPATPEPPWHEGIITKGADGVETLADFASWRDKAPAPLSKFIADNMTAARAKTEGMLKLPGQDDPPEAWDAFYKAVGRPDKPEEYGIAKPEKLPEGIEWSDETAKDYASWAHEAGLTKRQAEIMQKRYTERLGAEAAAMKQAGMQMVEAERKELTEAFGPKLAEVAGKAQEAAVKAGLPKEIFDPGAAAFLGAPALKMVAGLIGELEKFTKEGSFHAPNAGGGTGGGYAYAEQVISGKHPDSEAYWKNDRAVVQRVTEGLKQAPKQAA